jgi:hypothetical protein
LPAISPICAGQIGAEPDYALFSRHVTEHHGSVSASSAWRYSQPTSRSPASRPEVFGDERVFFWRAITKKSWPTSESGNGSCKTISRSPPEMFLVSVLEITTLANGILLGHHEIREVTPKLIGSILRRKLGLCTERSSASYALNLSSSQRLWPRCLILLFRPAATLPSLASHEVADSRA